MINRCLSTDSYHVQLNDVDLNSCRQTRNLLEILSFNLWSDNLEIPGYLDVSLSLRLAQNYSTIQSTYTITFQRKRGPIWINLSCLTDSCSAKSLCTLIKNSCSSIKSCNKNCQLSSGSHTLEYIRIPLKEKFFQHKIFTNGQYKLKIKFYDHTKRTIGCVDGYLTLQKHA